jgi:hypothetical protein
MGINDSLDLTALTRDYMFANMPAYLFKRFRGNDSVATLSQKIPVETLVAEYCQRTATKERSLEDVVVAYAILVSFSFLESNHARMAFEQVDLSRLEWGQEMAQFAYQIIQADNIITIRIPATPKLVTGNDAGSLSAKSGTVNTTEISLHPSKGTS